MALNKKQLAILHIAKKDVGLSEREYRELLLKFGVVTSRNLNYLQFETIMNYLKSLGFRGRARPGGPSSPVGQDGQFQSSKYKLRRKIFALLADMGLPDRYADAIAAQMFAVPKIQWLDPEQLVKIVAALMYEQKRRMAE
jgi:phage gp16-like protein